MPDFLTRLDYTILFWIQDNIVSTALTPLFKAITMAGNGGAIWIVLCAALLCFKKTRFIGVTALAALVCVHILNNELIKELVQRPRPFYGVDIDLLIATPGGWSFPSGHTSSSFAVATAVFLKDRKIGGAALVLAALMGFSRLYFFVHFPSDVCVGCIEGILVAIAVTFAASQLQKKLSSTSGKP